MSGDILPQVRLPGIEFSDSPAKFNETPSSIARIENIPTPDDFPKKINYSAIPKEILKSSTMENLMSQNDDLMARLKVSIRRLAIVENENLKIQEESRKIKSEFSTITDKMLILQEKENSWKKELQKAGQEKDHAIEKAKHIEHTSIQLKAEVERYKKYHDRIKQQVKPYINHLKEFARGLEANVAQLEGELHVHVGITADLRAQLVEMSETYRSQSEVQERKIQDMVQFYESHFEKQDIELKDLRLKKEELELQATKLNKTLSRLDLAENELIQIKRKKEDLKERLDKEIRQLNGRLQELTKTTSYQEIELTDLKQRAVEDEHLIKSQNKKIEDLTQQLEGLRYMWNAKNEENEKLRASLDALEKLNLSLSSKLNDWRE